MHLVAQIIVQIQIEGNQITLVQIDLNPVARSIFPFILSFIQSARQIAYNADDTAVATHGHKNKTVNTFLFPKSKCGKIIIIMHTYSLSSSITDQPIYFYDDDSSRSVTVFHPYCRTLISRLRYAIDQMVRIVQKR